MTLLFERVGTSHHPDGTDSQQVCDGRHLTLFDALVTINNLLSGCFNPQLLCCQLQILYPPVQDTCCPLLPLCELVEADLQGRYTLPVLLLTPCILLLLFPRCQGRLGYPGRCKLVHLIQLVQ